MIHKRVPLHHFYLKPKILALLLLILIVTLKLIGHYELHVLILKVKTIFVLLLVLLQV